jgi:hypothetical protein
LIKKILPVLKAPNVQYFFHASSLRRLGDRDDDVHSLANQGAHGRRSGFGNKLFHADQTRPSIVCVDSANAAGMARVPGFQQSERFSAPRLTQANAIGPKPHRHFQKPELIDIVRGSQHHMVVDRALKLSCIFNEDDAMIGRGFRNEPQNCVRQGGFASCGTAYHKDVLAIPCGGLDRVPLALRHKARRNIVREREDLYGLPADREARCRDNRRYHRLETAPI